MSDKTYAETQGEAPFDWIKALESPNRYDHNTLKVKAGSWVTCAVGNRCSIIPRLKTRKYRIGEPKDEQLRELGMKFYSSVCLMDWESAKSTLRAIEDRSAILIAKELAKLNQP